MLLEKISETILKFYSGWSDNVIKTGLKELLFHKIDLIIFSLHATEHFPAFKLKVFVINWWWWQHSHGFKSSFGKFSSCLSLNIKTYNMIKISTSLTLIPWNPMQPARSIDLRKREIFISQSILLSRWGMYVLQDTLLSHLILLLSTYLEPKYLLFIGKLPSNKLCGHPHTSLTILNSNHSDGEELVCW